MAEENKQTGQSNPPKLQEASKKKRVRVICEGTLGHKLLRKGDVTDDENYVRLLATPRGRTLVEEVK